MPNNKLSDLPDCLKCRWYREILIELLQEADSDIAVLGHYGPSTLDVVECLRLNKSFRKCLENNCDFPRDYDMTGDIEE